MGRDKSQDCRRGYRWIDNDAFKLPRIAHSWIDGSHDALGQLGLDSEEEIRIEIRLTHSLWRIAIGSAFGLALSAHFISFLKIDVMS